DYPPPHIDYVASDSQMEIMLAHIEKVWSQYGNDDAYWSVLTSEKFRKESLTPSRISDFYDSGKDTMRQIEMSLRRCGKWGNLGNRCLEYGCGVGRVTVHLAKLFKEVTGVDISKGHLDIASDVSKQMGIDNIEWKKVKKINELNSLGLFDFIFTVIVLQHNPPPIIASILKSFFTLLRNGGVAMFQLPTRIRNYRFDIQEYINNLDSYSEMEGHALTQNAVLEIAAQYNCRPLEIQCDNWVGSPNVVSQTFLFIKDMPS
ncbi:MAG: class I SAM-dependent methyltransferase, partial [Planctomycetes bacterium]|nr:class I SAM-dependent methyltransferase [Planctomycetota bacterium]